MIQHEIIVHDNNQSDELEQWAKKNDIIYTSLGKDVGYGAGLTNALKQATKSHVMVMKPMTYMLPNWERPLFFQIDEYAKHKIGKYVITCALYHYLRKWDGCQIKKEEFFDHFDADHIQNTYIKKRGNFYLRTNKYGFHWPMVFPRFLLKEIGYADKNYLTETGLDYDLAARAYFQAECRYFVRLAKSRVHYFGYQPRPEEIGYAKEMFKNTWTISQSAFWSSLIGAKTYAEIA